MKAVNSELSYVQTCSCNCPFVYRTMWDILCNQLFMQLPPPGIDEDDTFQEVKIWNEGVITMTKTTAPYTFTIEIETDTPPKASDVILFGKRNFYIIGEVSAAGNVYTCTGCLSIDVSIVGAYADMIAMNAQAIPAESARVEAENGRVSAEDGRVAAESRRATDFDASQEERTTAYNTAEGTEVGSQAGDGSRWGAFKSAEASRTARIESLLAPWVVPGAIVLSNNHFIEDDHLQTPQEGYTKFHAGFNVHLVDRSGRTERVIADDGTYLITTSGWKWLYAE